MDDALVESTFSWAFQRCRYHEEVSLRKEVHVMSLVSIISDCHTELPQVGFSKPLVDS